MNAEVNKESTFSVLVPTLNRSGTLGDVLESCIRQADENFRIIVSDNHSDDATRSVVKEYIERDSRVSLISPPSKLAMAQHWDWAIRKMPEGFFMVLGSDDALVPDGVSRARELLEEHEGVKAIVGSWSNYHYPSIGSGSDGGLHFQISPNVEIRNGPEWLARLASGQCGPGELPMPYALAFVHTDGIQEIIKKTGRLISSSCPDYYTGVALAAVTEEYVYTRQPLAIAGISSGSNGLLCLNPSDSSSIGRGAKFVQEGEETWDSSIPYVANWHIILGETILQAQKAGMFGSEIEIRWDRLAAQAYHEMSGQNWSESDARLLFADLSQVASAMGYPELFSGVEGLHSSSGEELLRIAFDGWVGEDLDINLDSRDFGVKNVADAARLVGIFLGSAVTEARALDYVSASDEEISRAAMAEILKTQLKLRENFRLYGEEKNLLEASAERLSDIASGAEDIVGELSETKLSILNRIEEKLQRSSVNEKTVKTTKFLRQAARRLRREVRLFEKLTGEK